MRSTDDQSTIRWLLVVGLYCFRGLKIDFNQNLSLCDRCTKSVRVHQYTLHYTRETECHVQAEADTEARVPAEIFQSFLLHASEAGDRSRRLDGGAHTSSCSRPRGRAHLPDQAAGLHPHLHRQVRVPALQVTCSTSRHK